MMRFETALLLLLTPSFIAVGDEPKKKAQITADQDLLPGNWQAVRMVYSGDEIPAESVKKLQLEITARWYLPGRGPIKWLQRGKDPIEAKLPEIDGVWEIDSTKEPKSLVLYRPQGPSLVLRLPFRGIYKLEGDTLTVCFGNFGKEPASFDEKESLQFVVYKRRRVAKPKPAK
jgi:uncharacterized protein (TIGR03067 family)